MVEFLVGIVFGYILGLYTASKNIRSQTNKALSNLWRTAGKLQFRESGGAEKTKKGGRKRDKDQDKDNQNKPQGLDEDYWFGDNNKIF